MRRPFGWFDFSPEAQALLRDQPARFERMELSDGPVAQGRLMPGPKIVHRQPDLFAEPEAAADPDQMELFG